MMLSGIQQALANAPTKIDLTADILDNLTGEIVIVLRRSGWLGGLQQNL
jgi:hypothetical protein